MGQYDQLATDIVTNVGGRDNINHVGNCMTRLRFDLKDQSLANDAWLQEHPEIVGLVKSGGQYQLVIGTHVPDLYLDVVNVIGGGSDGLVAEGMQRKRSPLQVFQAFIYGVMMPIIGVLAASGIMQGILAVTSNAGILSPDHELYLILNAVGQALFWFFPIFIGLNVAKALGMNQYLGALIGAAMMFPEIQNLEEASLFGVNISGLSYGQTIIPVMIVCVLAAPIARFLDKRLPNVIKGFITPLIVLAIVVPIGFALIGPFANMIGDGLATVLQAIASFNLPIASMIIGATLQVLVILGISHALGLVVLMDLFAGNPSHLLAPMIGSSFSVLAVTFVIWLKTRDKKLKSATFPAWLTAVFGITEPAVFGILLPRLKYLIFALIGAGVTGLYLGLTRVTTYRFSGLGVFQPGGMIGPDVPISNLINFLIAALLGMLVAGVLTWIFYRDPVTESPAITEQHKAEKHHLKAITEERKAERHHALAMAESGGSFDQFHDASLLDIADIGTQPATIEIER